MHVCIVSEFSLVLAFLSVRARGACEHASFSASHRAVYLVDDHASGHAEAGVGGEVRFGRASCRERV